MKSVSVIVAGGGTAGHIEPALNVGEAIRTLRKSSVVTAVGTKRGLETTLVPARGFPLEFVDPVPLPRDISADLAKLVYRIPRSVAQALRIIKSTRADVVVGFGGYASLPVYLAAALVRCPIVVHEANARAGLANRVGARFAVRVLSAVSGSGLTADVVGNPVAARLRDLDRAALRDQGRKYFGIDSAKKTILVTGGSQGAQSLNVAFHGAAKDLQAVGIAVLHAVGPKHFDSFSRDFDGHSDYVVVPYIERMDLAYAAADLVVCRSGAMTVAEIAAVGLPAVFVPLPHGNGEQALNSRDAVAAGAAWCVADADFDSSFISSKIAKLLADPQQYGVMCEASAQRAGPDIAGKIARIVLNLADGGDGYPGGSL